jgi:hypothetical protein
MTDIPIEEVTNAFQILLDPRIGIIQEIKESVSKPKCKEKELPGVAGECRGMPGNDGSDQSNQSITKEINQSEKTPLFQIPTTSQYESYPIDQERLDVLKARYPGLDVLHELEGLRGRILENPKLAPRPEKASKFVTTCLENAAKGGTGGKSNPKAQAEAVPLNDVAIMQDVHRKWPQVSKNDIADLFDAAVDGDPVRLAKVNEVLQQATTWPQFEKLAHGIAA